jgi:HK97 family phage major capsid protein
MSMSVAEARAEIKKRFEEAEVIENRYDDPEKMPNEDRQQVKRLLGEIDGLEDKLSALEDKESRTARILDGIAKYTKPVSPRPGMQAGDFDGDHKRYSPGSQFIGSPTYKDLKLRGAFNSALQRVEFAVNLADGTSLLEWQHATKALLRGGSSTSGQPFVIEDHRPGYIDILQRELNVLDLLPRLPTESDTIEYVLESTFTNNAAFTAEATGFTATSLGGAGVKPESALAYSTQTGTVKTLAHWIPITNRMLSDAPAIRGIIDGRLLLGLTLVLENQVVSGDGTGENLTGITNVAGINVVGKGLVASENNLDAIFRGRNLVRITGHGRPSAILMHPTDFGLIRLARESASTATPGAYLMGPPTQTGATTLWGMPVVESEAIAAGTSLVADWAQGCTLFDREQGAVRVGTINDQFVRNMQTVLAELRAAFIIWRPTCFTKVTGIA